MKETKTTVKLTAVQQLARKNYITSSPEVIAARRAGVSLNEMLDVIVLVDKRFFSTLK
jgi:hypothetical protein